MIGSLRGLILDRVLRNDNQAELLVEAGGVGYRVVVPAGSAGRAGELGGPTFLHVHTHVREDAIVLYGFPSREERDCFEVLLGAHGVGPAVAVGLLSVLSPAALRRAVLDDNADALTMAPGIGKKTAARLIVELGPRFEVIELASQPSAVAGTGLPAAGAAGAGGAAADEGDAQASEGGAGPHEGSAADRTTHRDEVRAALVGLGYAQEEVRQTLARLPSEGGTADLLRHALRDLAGNR
ncbi:MAG: Holliday junction branch migration protein RuvA [Acidimicrobiales bacterium]